MTLWTAPKINENISYEELVDLVARLAKDVAFIINGNIDSRNTREIGGYIVSPDKLMSKTGQVGFSSLETGGNDVRIWAGDGDMEEAPFRVYENGYMVATNGYFTGSIEASSIFGSDITGSTITGGTIQTQLPGSYPRIELNSTVEILRAYASDIRMLSILASRNGYPYLTFVDGVHGTDMWQQGDFFQIGSSDDIVVYPEGELRITSGGDTKILPFSGDIIITSWNRLVNNNTGRTLQQDLDALAGP